MNEARDQDRLLDHQYDGIQEYDNPLPRWWLWIFYVTIVFAVLYLLNVPGIGIGKGRIANYERAMAAAGAQRAAAEAATPEPTEAALLAMSRDPATTAAGKTLFVTNCSPCHRPDGGGVIGPNLTDDFWIHGGLPLQILHTVRTGVQEKGMPAWGMILKPSQLPTVVAYVITLRGSNPPNPKAPQGTQEEHETPHER